ncbi:MAG: STAS domain-containing protein [Planctomycetota bacterium]
MKIERRTSGDVTLLSFRGELDAFNLGAVTDKLDKLIESGVRRLIFNMQELRRINSSALGYMLKTRKRLAQMGGDLVVTAPSACLSTAMTTLGLDQVMRVFPDDKQALKYLHNGGASAPAAPTPPPTPSRELEETARD